ncbi:hypothetical protein E2542_SST29056 [Spatholobus suberectus]|nr:hypothetical protein E2542_SST29056 [Spatholobus suberectus]
MAPKPETEDGLGPRELKSVSISKLVSELRDSFPSGEFDRVEEALVAREARLGAELEEKRREIGSLKERIDFERLERIKAELELKRVREERGDERLVKNDGFGLDDGEIVVKNEKCKLESVGGVESGKVGVWGEKERKVCEEGKRVVGINGSVPLKRNEGGGLGASGWLLLLSNQLGRERAQRLHLRRHHPMTPTIFFQLITSNDIE